MDVPEGPIDADLAAAYRAARYVVDAPGGPLALSVGQPCAGVDALMRAAGCRSAAFITAWNPWSRLTPDASNAAAQQALESELHALGCRLLPGEGHDAAGAWPSERSVLALGLGAVQGLDLARRWGQNAFVWIEAPGAPCTLVFTRPVADGAGHVDVPIPPQETP